MDSLVVRAPGPLVRPSDVRGLLHDVHDMADNHRMRLVRRRHLSCLGLVCLFLRFYAASFTRRDFDVRVIGSPKAPTQS